MKLLGMVAVGGTGELVVLVTRRAYVCGIILIYLQFFFLMVIYRLVVQ